MRPGEPKKGGGGGMFTWGRLDDSGNHRLVPDDPNDPNYDSEPSVEYQEYQTSSNASPAKPPISHSHQQTPIVLSPEF